tara:strand:- start:501 stop:668 length:168 start_codon:yes stop_codon:yes gene_type:complete
MGKVSLNGTEWQELACFTRALSELKSKKNLTNEERCVILWMENKIKYFEEKKLKP